MLGKYNKNSISISCNILAAHDPSWDSWDDEDDVGCVNFEDDFGTWDEKADDVPATVLTCRTPQDHRFERNLLLNSYYRECLFCGYSPELDGSKAEFTDIHKNFLTWEGRHKI